MSFPDDPLEGGARRSFAEPGLRLWRAGRAWAATEAGGWTIIGALAGIAVLILALMLLGRQRAAADPPSVAAPSRTSLAKPTSGQVEELTLAPDELQDMTFDDARAWNARLPFSIEPGQAARSFIAPVADVESYGRALDCLTAAVYYEAGAETPAGQAAVAQVVLNRVRHPAYPRTVCGVVFQGSERVTGCQFTFTCDGALARPPSTEGWARARAVAMAALNGSVAAAVGTATHYHTDWVAPYWAPRLAKITQLGTHIFYRWSGAWGRLAAFTGAYAGGEPVVVKMAALSTAIVAETPILVTPIIGLPPLEPITGRPPPPIVVEDMQVVDLAPPTPVEVVAPRPAQQAAARAARRDTTIMADPLRSPAGDRPRERPRVAAPSSW